MKESLLGNFWKRFLRFRGFLERAPSPLDFLGIAAVPGIAKAILLKVAETEEGGPRESHKMKAEPLD